VARAQRRAARVLACPQPPATGPTQFWPPTTAAGHQPPSAARVHLSIADRCSESFWACGQFHVRIAYNVSHPAQYGNVFKATSPKVQRSKLRRRSFSTRAAWCECGVVQVGASGVCLPRPAQLQRLTHAHGANLLRSLNYGCTPAQTEVSGNTSALL
jgi:hypothetical protein